MDLMEKMSELDKRLALKEVENECAYREYMTLRDLCKQLKREVNEAEEALRILREAGEGVRRKLFRRLSQTVTFALRDIFGEKAYRFKVNSRFTGKKMSIEFILKRGRKEFDPLESVGHGVADIISFALRVALLSMKTGTKRAVLILDEPFRNVSEDYRERVGQFLRKVCTETGVQIIMSTHIKEFAEAADKVFTISKGIKGKRTEVRESAIQGVSK